MTSPSSFPGASPWCSQCPVQTPHHRMASEMPMRRVLVMFNRNWPSGSDSLPVAFSDGQGHSELPPTGKLTDGTSHATALTARRPGRQGAWQTRVGGHASGLGSEMPGVGGGSGDVGGQQKPESVVWRLPTCKGSTYVQLALKKGRTEISCNESPRKRPVPGLGDTGATQWQQRAGGPGGPPRPGRHGACPPPAPTQLGS